MPPNIATTSSLKRKSSSHTQVQTCGPTTKKRKVQPGTVASGSSGTYTLNDTHGYDMAKSSQASPLKGKRKSVKNSDAPVAEKRGARLRTSCPQNIMERVHRVMSQRFFMIDRQRTPAALQEVFSVLGLTGNVYTVTINHKPSCDCPDASKGNHCKHILFIFLKVLQVPQSSNLWYQKALLSTELQSIFDVAPLAPNDVANVRIREAHALATGKAPAAGPSTPEKEGTNKRRIPGPDDDCPICYDSMGGVGEGNLVFCEECGNALHKECFRQWQASTTRDGKKLTCVWCRAAWSSFPGPGSRTSAGGITTSEGYLNLGTISGASPVRDTSTYYHGPRGGYRFRRY